MMKNNLPKKDNQKKQPEEKNQKKQSEKKNITTKQIGEEIGKGRQRKKSEIHRPKKKKN